MKPAGPLRVSRRWGTAHNSLRSDTWASPPPSPLRCSVRFTGKESNSNSNSNSNSHSQGNSNSNSKSNSNSNSKSKSDSNCHGNSDGDDDGRPKFGVPPGRPVCV